MKSTHDDSQAPVPPVLPNGDELFNMIMKEIEPELTTDMVDSLDAKYARETPEEHKVRMKRYNAAYKEYDKRYAAYMSNLKKDFHGYKKSFFAFLEPKNSQNESSVLDSLSSAIAQL